MQDPGQSGRGSACAAVVLVAEVQYSRKQVKERSDTMQDPGQSGRGSAGAGVVVVQRCNTHGSR